MLEEFALVAAAARMARTAAEMGMYTCRGA